MSHLTDTLRFRARDIAALLGQPQSTEVDNQLDTAASELLVAVADGFALLVEAAEGTVAQQRSVE